MARPRKLIDVATGKIGKSKVEERKKEEAALGEFTPISFTPPSWLTKEAKTEYRRIIPLLQKLPVVALDWTAVSMYCDFYAKYKKASQEVEEIGTTIIEYDSKGNEREKVNPKYTVMTDAAKMVRSLAMGLGMTIDSRMRIVVPKKEEVRDPFADMMNDD